MSDLIARSGTVRTGNGAPLFVADGIYRNGSVVQVRVS
jgi:hypothetical protein